MGRRKSLGTLASAGHHTPRLASVTRVDSLYISSKKFPVFHRTRIMAFTDATLAIVCTSCAVPLWANGTHNFNPVRLVPFVTSFFILVRLWYVEMQNLCYDTLGEFSTASIFPGGEESMEELIPLRMFLLTTTLCRSAFRTGTKLMPHTFIIYSCICFQMIILWRHTHTKTTKGKALPRLHPPRAHR